MAGFVTGAVNSVEVVTASVDGMAGVSRLTGVDAEVALVEFKSVLEVGEVEVVVIFPVGVGERAVTKYVRMVS